MYIYKFYNFVGGLVSYITKLDVDAYNVFGCFVSELINVTKMSLLPLGNVSVLPALVVKYLTNAGWLYILNLPNTNNRTLHNY